MPIININGGKGPAGGAPNSSMPTGPRSQIPSMRPDYDAAWNSNAKNTGKNTPDDYARALAQKEAQDRRAAATARQAQAKTDADFRRSQQQSDMARRLFERNTAAETRAYEQAQRAMTKADADRRRQQERDAKAQEQLQRRQAADRDRGQRQHRAQEFSDARAIDSQRTRRMREEAQLAKQLDNIRYRAGRTLTPSGYDNVHRQASAYRKQASQFQGRYGYPPPGSGGMDEILTGTGTRANSYAAQNIMSLGNRGQRAADGREWTSLARVEQELRRIERTNEAILANGTKSTADQKANATRNLEATRDARSRIDVARSGTSAIQSGFGSAMGTAALMMTNPVVDVATAAAAGLTMSPFLAAFTAQKVFGLADQYDRLREGTSALGRAGGFNSFDLQDPMFPGTSTPGFLKTLGMTTESARGLLGDYGVATRSPEEALQLVSDTRRAYLSPMMGLDDSALAQSAGLSRTLGITGRSVLDEGKSYAVNTEGDQKGELTETSGQTDTNAYFSRLQKVMALATTQGLDHATTLKNVEGLLRMTAGAGAGSVNAGALTGFFGQMVNSGLPGMRSGEGITSAMSGINSAFNSIGVGGAPAQNVMMMSYFGKHGGMPKTEADLQKFLGMSDSDWKSAQAQPGHAQMVENYLRAAGQNPAFALTYLSPLLQGRPDLMQQVFEGSSFGQANPMIRPLLGGNVTGAGYQGYVAMTSGSRNLGNPPKTAPIPSRQVADSIRAASNFTGIPEYVLKGLAAKESSLNPMASNDGALGLMQMRAGARQDTGLADVDAFDVQKNTLAGAKYLKSMYGLFDDDDKDRTMHAYEAYEWGPAHAADIKAGRVPQQYVDHAQTAMGYATQYANYPLDQFSSRANVETLGLTASRDARENAVDLLGQAPGDAVVAFSHAIYEGTTAVEGFVRALVDGTQSIRVQSYMQVPGTPAPNFMDPTGGAYLLPPSVNPPARP